MADQTAQHFEHRITLVFKSKLNWHDGDRARVLNAGKSGSNPADRKKIVRLEARIKRMKIEAADKLSVIFDQLEFEKRKCNHCDGRGNGIMSGFTYAVCPICDYSA